MILSNILTNKNKNYQINSREFTFFTFLVLLFIIINTLIYSLERIFLWEELKNNFIASEGNNFNEANFNAISLSSYFIPFGGILVFTIFLIFGYKRNGTSYFFPTAWLIIWILAMIGIWFNDSISIWNKSLTTVLGLFFITALSFLLYKVRKFKQRSLVNYKYENGGGTIVEDILPFQKQSNISLLKKNLLEKRTTEKENQNLAIKKEKEKILGEL